MVDTPISSFHNESEQIAFSPGSVVPGRFESPVHSRNDGIVISARGELNISMSCKPSVKSFQSSQEQLEQSFRWQLHTQLEICNLEALIQVTMSRKRN